MKLLPALTMLLTLVPGARSVSAALIVVLAPAALLLYPLFAWQEHG